MQGYLVDWDAQKAVWDGIFSDEVLGVDTTNASLLITEPYFNLPNIQEVYDQFVFEEYEFQSYHRCTPASLMPYGNLFSGAPEPECMLIVDSGFSFTHVVPILNRRIFWSAVKRCAYLLRAIPPNPLKLPRLNVGGKLLTNQIMNHVKESCCFVSLDFDRDLETCRVDANSNGIVQEYILPDLTRNKHGRVREPNDMPTNSDQILVMNSERFTVPELIFRPDDLGFDQMGLAAAIAFSIGLLPEELHGLFWANIGLIGGNTKFPKFRVRLLNELRSLAPVECEVTIYESAECARFL